VRQAVQAAVAATTEVRAVVLDLSDAATLDVTSADVLIELTSQLRAQATGL
jgi:anti-anti-sigma regulatory factor